MINFGAVPAGSVLPIFFDSYAGSTGASITITGLAVTDIEIYKGTSMTQRSSDAGYTLLDTDGIDLDGITGIHGFSIDLGDNTDAGFYAAGSFYNVVVSAITVDSQTVNFVAATFRIVAAENTAGYPVIDAAKWNNLATVALPLVPTTAGRTLDVSAGGEAGVDWANVGSPTTAVDLSGTTIKTTQKVDIDTIKTQSVTCAAGVTVLASVGTAATSTAQTGDSYAIVNGASGLVAIKGDTAAILVDTGTTLDGRIPAALTAGGNMKVDVLAISGSTAAADALEESTEAIAYGTVDGTGATTTAFLSSALTPDSAVNDQFNGRVLIFKADTTTANLRGQATTISDYVHTSAEVGTFTVVALTTAPQTGDTFVIL